MNCFNRYCSNQVEGMEDYVPEYCCSGISCGCMGLPVNPVFCDECEDRLTGGSSKIFKKCENYLDAKKYLEYLGKLGPYFGRSGMYSEYYLWDFLFNEDGKVYKLKISEDGRIEKSR